MGDRYGSEMNNRSANELCASLFEVEAGFSLVRCTVNERDSFLATA